MAGAWTSAFSTYLRSLWIPKSSSSPSPSPLASLNLPPSTAKFVIALPLPQNPSSVVYIVSVSPLSAKSASDVREVVAAAKPSVVVSLIETQELNFLHEEEKLEADEGLVVPTSAARVIHEHFLKDIETGRFESLARVQTLRTIFGTGLFGHVLAAKEEARKAGARFFYLDFPHKTGEVLQSKEETKVGSKGGQLGQGFASSFAEFSYQEKAKWRALLGLGSAKSSVTTQERHGASDESSPPPNGKSNPVSCPSYAEPFFPFLTTLKEIYDTPALALALQSTTHLLQDVECGKDIKQQDLSDALNFRHAVEKLREQCNENIHALNPDSKPNSRSQKKLLKIEFDDLSYGDKTNALLAQSLQQEAKRSGTVVAVMDVRRVEGLCAQWVTKVPDEYSTLADECYISLEEAAAGNILTRGSLRMDFGGRDYSDMNAAVAVGAGTAAAFGLASFSFSDWGPMTPFMTFATLKASAIAKLGFIQWKRSLAMALAKGMSPASKVALTKATKITVTKATKFSVSKGVMSAEKIRATAQSVVAAAEKASLSAIRTAFYSIMRMQQGKHVDRRPWLLFSGSVAAGCGIWFYGDGLERAIAGAPSAPSVARLGRGLENLSKASADIEPVQEELHTKLHSRRDKVN